MAKSHCICTIPHFDLEAWIADKQFLQGCRTSIYTNEYIQTPSIVGTSPLCHRAANVVGSVLYFMKMVFNSV
jgi:hypothetical protein